MASPEFVLSTLAPAPANSPTPYLPRARYCIFRGFWAELPQNKHNDAPKNPRIYESDMPTFTTDVRMEKVGQLFGSSSGKADRNELVQGSGGGGPVEAVWWVKENGIMTQWRIRGEAFVVAPDIETKNESSGVRTVKSEIRKRMRSVQPEHEADWSWLREIDSHFGNLSPGMRGSFRAPPPGQPVSEPYDDKKLKLGENIDDMHDPVARKHFRVVIIKPKLVEQTDLSDPAKARRYLFTYQEASGDWKETEEWP